MCVCCAAKGQDKGKNNGKLMRLVAAFHACLGAALRKPKNKPCSELRVCADAGELVLRVHSGTFTLWAHLAFARYQPIGMVLLRLRQETELDPHNVSLQIVWQLASEGSSSWWWCSSRQFMQACVAANAASFSVTFWRVRQVETVGESNIRVGAQRIAEVARLCGGDVAGGSSPGDGDGDEDDEEAEEEAQSSSCQDTSGSGQEDVPEWMKDRSSDDDIPHALCEDMHAGMCARIYIHLCMCVGVGVRVDIGVGVFVYVHGSHICMYACVSVFVLCLQVCMHVCM